MSGSDWLNLEKLANSGGQGKAPTKDVPQRQSTPRPKAAGGRPHVTTGEGRATKRQRAGEERSVESPPFELDDLTEKDFELFKKEPLRMCSDLCDSANKFMKTLIQDRSRAEAERDAAQKSLEQLRAELLEANNARANAEKDKKLAEDDRAGMSKRNKELFEQNKSLKVKVSNFEEEKQAAISEKVKEVAQMAKGAAVFQFGNAVAQLRLLNADRPFHYDEKIIKADHLVEDGEIVLPLKTDDEGKVIQKRSVVFGRAKKN